MDTGHWSLFVQGQVQVRIGQGGTRAFRLETQDYVTRGLGVLGGVGDREAAGGAADAPLGVVRPRADAIPAAIADVVRQQVNFGVAGKLRDSVIEGQAVGLRVSGETILYVGVRRNVDTQRRRGISANNCRRRWREVEASRRRGDPR